MAPGAAASGSLRGCPNETVVIEIPTGEGTKTEKFHEHVKTISSQGVSCAAAEKFIQKFSPPRQQERSRAMAAE
jgi:hypothetical protein